VGDGVQFSEAMRNPELNIPESVLRLPRFPEKEIFRVACDAVSDVARIIIIFGQMSK